MIIKLTYDCGCEADRVQGTQRFSLSRVCTAHAQPANPTPDLPPETTWTCKHCKTINGVGLQPKPYSCWECGEPKDDCSCKNVMAECTMADNCCMRNRVERRRYRGRV